VPGKPGGTPAVPEGWSAPSAAVARTGLAHHIIAMARTHPHAEASYRVISLPDGGFGVEVSIPDSNPTTVSPFTTEADADAWIAKHKDRVEAQSASTGWFRRQGPRANPSTRR
jgi:hypothetical protein